MDHREVQGNPELQNADLKALEKAWATSCRFIWFCGRMELVERGLAPSRELPGEAGRPALQNGGLGALGEV